VTPNRYLREGDGRAAGVQDLFAAIASRYDLINDLQSFGLHRRWKRRVIRLAQVRAGESALDLCCGTGDLAFALAAAGARVTGVDFSEPMLAIARRRQGTRGASASVGDLHFEKGDALALAFEDESFDLVTVGYGLRNLQSIGAGLAEIARVTRAGGRLLILDFAKPTQRVWRALYLLHLRTLVPWLGRVLCGDAQTHAYILESLRRYPEAPQVAGLMEAVGWGDVKWWSLLGGVMTIHRGFRQAGFASRCAT
jgi:demethylmenaquinone methyltransferase/2-methoxy-6-polyprenyl-1,4-benzoquinol methylase